MPAVAVIQIVIDSVDSLIGAERLVELAMGKLYKKPVKGKDAKQPGFDQDSNITENIELITKFQDKFRELHNTGDGERDLTFAEIAQLMGDKTCRPSDIAKIQKNIREASKVTNTMQYLNDENLLTILQEDLLDITIRHSKKIKEKCELSDVYDFYSEITAACKPLEKLNPSIHKSLIADIAKDMAELTQDMNDYAALVTDKTIKEHESKALRYKWISIGLNAIGVVCFVAGFFTMAVDFGATAGIGLIALGAANLMHKYKKEHEAKAQDLRESSESIKRSEKIANIDLSKELNVLQPVNSFIRKLKKYNRELEKEREEHSSRGMKKG